MKDHTRRLVVALLTVGMLFSLGACGDNEKNIEETTTEKTIAAETTIATESTAAVDEDTTFIFTDSTGREVELPRHISRVASGGPLANIMIYAVKPDVLVGWSSRPSEIAQKYIEEKYWELPEYGKFYSNNDNFNREALMTSNPEVIIDVGQWDEEYKVELDELQEQIGIPIILIEGELEDTPAAFCTLGELLEEPERGEALGEYCEVVLAEAKEKTASIPEEDRVRVYYAEGEDGLSTILSNTIHSQIYELIGAEIVVDPDSVQVQRGGGTVSLEQVLAWEPDVIMFAPNSIYDDVAADPSWNALAAIQQGNYYEIPGEPYNWLGRPPGPNRFIGIRWLGNLLYPDIYEYDIEEEVKTFFELVYRYELSDEEVAELLGHSTLKE
ncbi:MAG TPA: ABC transporter substrate-binding protein [Clostridiaceae bacterium]|nr:ABC transporter substrate-binding protein [Clostridiaceae bacterium]